ncbi:glycine cleavage system H protein [Clostridium argentinense CDC 2741]|uniref:Glycine cleavage system H protein n=1 Tax=Clostridium argentinense CDC 2741 TaxID=1418104 RepID=A0A0C1U4H2_9CLOT|nr:glycine cleavage system protein GcvH [Clostridium argentinense]ARC84611.1 glycine cleavage system protein H [Clostridium argentinense]KIE47689.1 glycine cleavage system H protein [Clostridium argentinense CDC 2741]NFF40116.1 glycine cleavage system protein GcvH [Clostridium argentinense]NFP50681.1 glycine cleavage system protein GcvH [Clostridium argentinense]NFP72371.1 glycine cleavage system protein GcvH [Clostridium argentinense]
MSVLDNLLYTKNHEWIRVEGNKAYIGITDYAQRLLGDIVFIELPEEGTEFSKGDAFGVVESVKAASDIYIPVSGNVVEFNEEIIDSPETVNENAYESWMIAVELQDESELKELLSPKEYENICDKEE